MLSLWTTFQQRLKAEQSKIVAWSGFHWTQKGPTLQSAAPMPISSKSCIQVRHYLPWLEGKDLGEQKKQRWWEKGHNDRLHEMGRDWQLTFQYILH